MPRLSATNPPTLLQLCHRPANVTASGPGGVIQKKNRKISNGQRGLPRRPGSSPAVEDGASQGARSDERSSLALDWRWPLPHWTVRIASMNSVNGSVPPVPTRSVGPVHDNHSSIEEDAGPRRSPLGAPPIPEPQCAGGPEERIIGLPERGRLVEGGAAHREAYERHAKSQQADEQGAQWFHCSFCLQVPE